MNSELQQPHSFEPESSANIDYQHVIEVDMLELRLPCRGFRIKYKVVEAGEFSLTTEFLMRLLRLADGMPEDAVSEFFGFSPDETRCVVSHVERFGYVMRNNGRVYLTEGGHALFTAGDELALFEVRSRQERFDFDLIAFAPSEPWKFLTPFEFRLPELSLPKSEDVGRASKRIIQAFSRHFQELRFKRGGSRVEKQFLYSVDDVQAGQRYSTTLPVTITVRADNAEFAEANLLAWRTGLELEDRAAVLQSCGEFVKGIRIRSDQVDPTAVECLLQCAGQQVARFQTDGALDVEGLFRATVRQAGELRIDRPTVRTVGHLWTDGNRTRFASALTYAVKRSTKAPYTQIWLRPTTPHWGMTTRVPELLGAVSRQFLGLEEDPNKLRSVMVSDENAAPAFKEVFNAVIRLPFGRLPRGLEIFLLPAHLAYIAIHTPVGVLEGYPIALGVISFDLSVVERVHHFLAP